MARTLEDSQERAPNRPGVHRRLRTGPPILRVIACVFLFLPVVLLLLGVRPADVDNHARSKLPPVRLQWRTLDNLNNYLTDNLPLRDAAIRENERLSESLFGQPAGSGQEAGSAAAASLPGSRPSGQVPAIAPGGEGPVPRQTQQQTFLRLPPPAPEPAVPSNSVVTVGKDGWLFLTGEFYKECEPGQPSEQVISGLARLQQILAASGRKFVFTLAPDKSTVEPSYLPDSYPLQSCSQASKRATFSLLNNSHIPGYVDMKDLMAARQSAEQRPYYMREDTHWNGLADALFARKAIQLLDPALLAGVVSKEVIGSYVGDLTTLLGDPHSDRTIDDTLSRPGVTVAQSQTSLAPGIAATESRAVSSATPLLPGRTLLVGDSFSQAAAPDLTPFLADMLEVKNAYFAEAPETMFNAIQRSSTIILVWNQRYFADPNYGVMWSSAFLDKLATGLRHV